MQSRTCEKIAAFVSAIVHKVVTTPSSSAGASWEHSIESQNFTSYDSSSIVHSCFSMQASCHT